MSKHHKLRQWLCGDVMHVHGSVKFCYSQTKPVEDCRSMKRFRKFKECFPGKVKSVLWTLPSMSAICNEVLQRLFKNVYDPIKIIINKRYTNT